MPILLTAFIRCALVLTVLPLITVSAWAQRDEPAEPPRKLPAELQARVDSTIDLAVESLLVRQSLDGSWSQQAESYRAGMTGLALYALLKSGLSREHPSVARGFAFLERQKTLKTYSRSTVLLALATRGAKKDKKRMQELVDELVDSQNVAGWGYPGGGADLSNTQFAATALRMAAANGLSVPSKVWTRLIESTLRCLEPKSNAALSGPSKQGFLYRPGHEYSTGSMTAAGVAILSICAENVRIVKPDHQRGIHRGLAWLAETFSVEHNPAPVKENGSNGVQYYYLYGIERVGSLRGIEKLGSFPWYRLGAEKLVSSQKDGGGWGSQSDTAFGLLFLARATGSVGPASGAGMTRSRWTFGGEDPKEDVSIRASGRLALTLWVSSFGDKVKAKYADEEDGLVPVQRVEYWLVVPGAENELLEANDIEDAAEGLRKRFAIQSDLTGPRTCKVFARVFVEGRKDPLQSKPLQVRIGMRERDSWPEYSTDHKRNLLADAEHEVTCSSERETPRELALNVTDGLIGVGWKPTADDTSPWIQIEPTRPISANTILLSHAGLGGVLLARYKIVINDKPKDALSGTMLADVREKTVITLPKAMRIRTLKIHFLDPIPHNCTGLGEIELQKRR